MGVSAVPGSGKTATLSYLAAQLITEVELEANQEILIVTLSKSAVANFSQSLTRFLASTPDVLGFGYRVRTLHSLANDIVHERPALANLSDDFTVIDERVADDILQDAVDSYVRIHAASADPYLAEEHIDNQHTRNHYWPDMVKRIAANFVRQAKDYQLTAANVREFLQAAPQPLPLATMCVQIYEQYQRGLEYRGAVDFQDLIRLALQVIQRDADYLARLRHRFPYILEDEAQDSSKLQEDILRMLVGKDGNWVRVGDPNQAIYESFTTANPDFLRNFLKEEGVQARTLPNSGRSTQSIIKLANELIRWTTEHPSPSIRAFAPLAPPTIEPTPEGDPQGNPPDRPERIYLRADPYTPQQEREAVIASLKSWVPRHPDKTCAVLFPINSSGAKMVELLRDAGVPYVENLRSTSTTRAVIGSLVYALNVLIEPKDSRRLAGAYRVWRRDERGDADAERSIDQVAKALGKLRQVEDFVWPRLQDWLEEVASENPALENNLQQFRAVIRRWHNAADLPIDQLVLTIAGDLFHTDTELATAYAAAGYLRRFAESQPEARLPEFNEELQAIARGQRSFGAISDEEAAFDPEEHKGKVTVTTMHRAKGLEFDRVYLMSVNNYDYPSNDPFDNYIGERWFIRDGLNLEAEALEQLDALRDGSQYREGIATAQARAQYAAERLRLLYVGITRARSELIITWNTGRRGEQIEARPLAALRGWWETQQTTPQSS